MTTDLDARRTPPRRLARVAAVALLALAFAPLPPAAADEAAASVRLDELVVRFDWRDALAVTNVSLALTNTGANATEILVNVPLSTSAVLTSFTLRTHNETLVGVVLERAAASTAYNASKARGEEAVLLQSAGKGRLTLLVNVPASASVRLNATYAEIVPLELGVREYGFPLSEFARTYGTVGRLILHGDIAGTHSWDELSAHGIPASPNVQSNGRATLDYEAVDAQPASDVSVRLKPTAGGYTSSLVAAGRGPEAALLFTLLPPGFGATPLPLDIVFVLDRSGSMTGAKIDQARQALLTILGQLREQDRFGLVSFSDTITKYEVALQAATPAHRDAARAWVQQVVAAGSTNLEGGTAAGLEILGAGETAALPAVVLITDGLPTSGITDPAQIVASLAEKNPRDARLHTVGIGLDQDTAFLTELATSTRGFYQAVGASEDVEAALVDFYARIATPILKDITIAFTNVDVRDVHPSPVPDAYQGSQIVLAGRADTQSLPPAVVVRVTGRDASGPVAFDLSVPTQDLAVRAEADRLWARQKAGSLERAMELARGDVNTTALGAQLLALGLQYQIETKATSWVIVKVTPDLPLPATPGPLGPGGGGPGGLDNVLARGAFTTPVAAPDIGGTGPATKKTAAPEAVVLVVLALAVALARRRTR